MSQSTCHQCHAPLAPGAKFCRSCGTAVPADVPSPVCPRCAHINPADSRFCRSCGTPLAPAGASVHAPRPAPAPAETTRQMPVAATPAAPPAAAAGVRKGPSTTLIAVIAVLVAAGGAGTVLALVAGGKSGHAVRHALAGAATSTAVSENETTSTSAAPVTSTNAPPATSSSQGDPYTEVSGIEAALLQHHEAIVDGNFRAAWNLTSVRYRHEKEGEPGGYGKWVTHQHTLKPYLVPNGLKVAIVSWEEQSQVATVRVSGMRWTAPGSRCRYWQGITWMHYENGSWYYEPGYSVSPQRRAEWEPRQSELLGSGCD